MDARVVLLTSRFSLLVAGRPGGAPRYLFPVSDTARVVGRRVLAAALVAMAACGGGRTASDDATLPTLPVKGGPEPVLLRFPIEGGAPRSYRWSAVDSAIWTSADRTPPLDRLLAFDDGGGMVALLVLALVVLIVAGLFVIDNGSDPCYTSGLTSWAMKLPGM